MSKTRRHCWITSVPQFVQIILLLLKDIDWYGSWLLWKRIVYNSEEILVSLTLKPIIFLKKSSSSTSSKQWKKAETLLLLNVNLLQASPYITANDSIHSNFIFVLSTSKWILLLNSYILSFLLIQQFISFISDTVSRNCHSPTACNGRERWSGLRSALFAILCPGATR